MKKILTIKPHVFENSIIIAFSKNWLDTFEKIPEFTVKINIHRKLVLESIEEVKKRGNETE